MARKRKSSAEGSVCAARTRSVAADMEACSADALRTALADWQNALGVFEGTDDPKLMELALIGLEAAHRRFGCLAAAPGDART